MPENGLKSKLTKNNVTHRSREQCVPFLMLFYGWSLKAASKDVIHTSFNDVFSKDSDFYFSKMGLSAHVLFNFVDQTTSPSTSSSAGVLVEGMQCNETK